MSLITPTPTPTLPLPLTPTEVGKRGVSLDEWTMLLQFCREIDPDCDNFKAELHRAMHHHSYP